MSLIMRPPSRPSGSSQAYVTRLSQRHQRLYERIFRLTSSPLEKNVSQESWNRGFNPVTYVPISDHSDLPIVEVNEVPSTARNKTQLKLRELGVDKRRSQDQGVPGPALRYPPRDSSTIAFCHPVASGVSTSRAMSIDFPKKLPHCFPTAQPEGNQDQGGDPTNRSSSQTRPSLNLACRRRHSGSN